MNVVVIVLLGLLWASILVPGLLRDRWQRSPQGSIDAFERSMGILANDLRVATSTSRAPVQAGPGVVAGDDPRGVSRPPARLRTLRRRRQVVQALVTAALMSGIAVAVAGPVALPLLGVTTTATLAYLGLLLHVRVRESRVRRTVRHLPGRHQGAGARGGGEATASRRVAGGAIADSPV